MSAPTRAIATARRMLGAALLILAAAACRDAQSAVVLAGANPAHGRVAIRAYGCGTCHTIAGVRSADGLVGPPLTGIANRVYIAGVLPNTPENLVQWIRFPRHVDPETAMPELGVSELDARDIASYLYTLK